MTQDEIIEMARQVGAGMLHGGEFALFGNEKLEEFAKLVAAKEREACARLSEEWQGPAKDKEIHIAAAIRARGQA